MDMNTLICEEKENGLYLLKLNRPRQLNALNMELLDELDRLLDELQGRDMRGLILTGEGTKAFAAGADIREMCDMTPGQAKAFSLKGNHIFRRIEELPVPVIAAVNGYALGGGCELAMSCDIILCSTKAVFAQPETGLGICPGFGGTIRLMRRIGAQRAKELIYSGRYMRADEAVSCGLSLRQYEADQLLEETEKLMGTFLANSSSAVCAAKKSMFLGADAGVDQAVYLEAECFSGCFTHPDQRSRMQRFLAGAGKG